MNFKKKLSFLLILIGIFITIYACSENSSSKQDIGHMLYDSGCNHCHGNTIICLNLGKDESYWKKTVSRMAKKIKGRSVNIDNLINTIKGLDKQNSLCN